MKLSQRSAKGFVLRRAHAFYRAIRSADFETNVVDLHVVPRPSESVGYASPPPRSSAARSRFSHIQSRCAAMAFLYKDVSEASDYGVRNWVRQGRDPEEYKQKLATSTTVYVGNLSFYTTEEVIWELFSKVGEVKRIIMGLNQFSKTPCGFCFVEHVF